MDPAAPVSEAPGPPGGRLSPPARVWLLTGGGVIVVALGLVYAARWPEPISAPHVPWLVFALLIAASERVRIHLHFARETHTFSLSELPTTIGLFLAVPGLLVAARALGILLALTPIHARSPLKLAFNVVNGAFEAMVAILLFRWLLPLVDHPVWGYAAGLGAMAVASSISTFLVWLVIRIVEGHRRVEELVAAIRIYTPIGVANAAVALAVVVVVRVDPLLVWVPLVPLGVLLVAYRAYAAQWQQRNALDFLYDTAVETHSVPDLNGSLMAVLRRGREQLKADVAELVVVRPQPSASALVVSLGPGTAEEIRQTDLTELPLEIRELLRDDSAPQEAHARESVWVRTEVAEGTILLIRVRNPIGNGAAFDSVALEVLRSLSRLGVTAVERAELEELKSAFLSAVSHELRTPLTVVLGAAATMKHRGDDLTPDARLELIDRLDRQARRLDKLLSDLLDIDRLTRGVLEPHRRLVDLATLAERVVGTLDTGGHTLRLQAETLLAEVDPALTERIVENLVKNAVKYTPVGTTITVEVLRTEDGVGIAVEDEGEGIPEERRAAVLDPFVRLDRDHPQPGTGIGLTLVRRFAQLHGGDVTIEDGAAGGARITAWLVDAPVVRGPEPDLIPLP